MAESLAIPYTTLRDELKRGCDGVCLASTFKRKTSGNTLSIVQIVQSKMLAKKALIKVLG
jgi:hypothetical protein